MLKVFAIAGIIILNGCTAVIKEAINNPENMTVEYFYSMRNMGFTHMTEHLHPSEMTKLKNYLLPLFEREARSGQRKLLDQTFGTSININTLKYSEPIEFTKAFMKYVVVELGKDKLEYEKMEILGSVRKMDELHVLARVTTRKGRMSVPKIEVLSFIPYKDTWAMKLNAEMEDILYDLVLENYP